MRDFDGPRQRLFAHCGASGPAPENGPSARPEGRARINARVRDNPLTRAMQNHIERYVAWMVSGDTTTSRCSRDLPRFLGRGWLRGVRPADLEIR
jgi:hypothetical protein